MKTQKTIDFQRFDEFDQELLRRQWCLRWEAIELFRLMFSAANGSPHEGIEGKFVRHHTDGLMYVMVATNQTLLAKLLKLSDDGDFRALCRQTRQVGLDHTGKPFFDRRTKPLARGGKFTT
jgi:hypothetical protein